MEVELEGEDGSKLTLGNDEKTVFGRGFGVNTHDRTVPRRHVCFQLQTEATRVSFEVIGRNPFWVCTGGTLRVFRKFDKGHLHFGDRFCFSGNKPLWFTFNNTQPLLNFDQIDVSQIDPVKEFGFLVMGHEFEQYPKGMIRNVKDWEWFLDGPRKDSEDEDDSGKEKRKMRRKRKLGKENEEDEEWGGESEDDKDLVANIRKGKLPGYSTRSKGPTKDTKASKDSKRIKTTRVDESLEEEEDEDDDTLGGFIVADEEDGQDEENGEEEEEEELEDDDDVEDSWQG